MESDSTYTLQRTHVCWGTAQGLCARHAVGVLCLPEAISFYGKSRQLYVYKNHNKNIKLFTKNNYFYITMENLLQIKGGKYTVSNANVQ